MNRSNIQFTLNNNVLKCLPFEMYAKDFTFIVNNKEYKTSRIIADILSPQIRKYHMSDSTIDTFTINTSNENSKHDFSEILSLINFNSHELDFDGLDYYRTIFIHLGNDEEYVRLLPEDSSEITLNNVISHLIEKQHQFQHRPDLLNSISRNEIEFISGHFSEIDHSELKKFDIGVIENIVKSSNLRIDSEDSLLKFVTDIYTEDRSASFLFDYVVFENVSKKGLLDFYQMFDLSDIDVSVWRMIFDRCVKSDIKYLNPSFCRRYTEYEGSCFLYEEGKEFDGIVRHLTEKTGGNIHKNGTIEVTSNNFQSGLGPWNLLDFDKDNYYCARSEWNVWICYDFRDKKVKVTNYQLNSIKGNRTDHHLKSWVVEVSDDGKNWVTIDEQKESQRLNGTNLSATFLVQPSEFVRYVRLRNTAVPWGGNYLWFSNLEFYGYLKDIEN